MRSRTIFMIRSWRAWSSAVSLRFFLFAIAVLQDDSDLSDVVLDVTEERHDSRHVSRLDRRLHPRIVPAWGSRPSVESARKEAPAGASSSLGLFGRGRLFRRHRDRFRPHIGREDDEVDLRLALAHLALAAD